MSKQALIAILDGCPDGAEASDGIRLLHLGRFTAALATDMSGVFSLLPNRRQALQQAVQRQAQLEQCMRLGTVLPVRPNAHLDDAAVQAFVTANAEILVGVSHRVRHAQQFQVTVKWTASDVLSHFRDAPEIAPLFAGERTTAPALQAAITRLATRLNALMQQEISGVAQDMILLPHTDDVIFNTVLLVRRAMPLTLIWRLSALMPSGRRVLPSVRLAPHPPVPLPLSTRCGFQQIRWQRRMPPLACPPAVMQMPFPMRGGRR